MIVAVTNCIAYEVAIPAERLYRSAVQHSLLTGGLLRLLQGRGFAPAGVWAPHYSFAPIDPGQVEAIIWSPFIDQTGYYPLVTCQDGTQYPWSDTAMVCAAGNAARPDLAEVFAWWTSLERLTAGVPVRLLVTYPSTFLQPARNASLHERIAQSTPVALENFKAWRHLTVEHPVLSDEGYWPHFTDASRAELLHQIALAVA